MTKVKRVDEFTGEFYFKSIDECIDFCERTAFVSDEEVEEVREALENAEFINRLSVRFDVPADQWTGYCEEVPQDVREVLLNVEERDVEEAPRIG